MAANREQELGQPRPSLDRIRGERTKFTQMQLTILEEYFNENPYLTSDKITELVEKLNLAPPKINVRNLVETNFFFKRPLSF